MMPAFLSLSCIPWMKMPIPLSSANPQRRGTTRITQAGRDGKHEKSPFHPLSCFPGFVPSNSYRAKHLR